MKIAIVDSKLIYHSYAARTVVIWDSTCDSTWDLDISNIAWIDEIIVWQDKICVFTGCLIYIYSALIPTNFKTIRPERIWKWTQNYTTAVRAHPWRDNLVLVAQNSIQIWKSLIENNPVIYAISSELDCITYCTVYSDNLLFGSRNGILRLEQSSTVKLYPSTRSYNVRCLVQWRNLLVCQEASSTLLQLFAYNDTHTDLVYKGSLSIPDSVCFLYTWHGFLCVGFNMSMHVYDWADNRVQYIEKQSLGEKTVLYPKILSNDKYLITICQNAVKFWRLIPRTLKNYTYLPSEIQRDIRHLLLLNKKVGTVLPLDMLNEITSYF